jgi:hypothetical protein
MTMRKRLGIIVLTAAAATGCLRKDTTHTVYLSPDGRASWMAIEKDVRSDETDPYRRVIEEQRYILAAGAGTHGVGLGLAALAPSRLQTRIVRNERPFVVVTEAHFSSLEFAIRRLLTELSVEGDVIVSHDGRLTTLTVRANAAAAVEKDDGPETSVGDLFEELDRYAVALTDGRFVRATGFALTEGDTVAVPVKTPWETIVANDGILEMSLTWSR